MSQARLKFTNGDLQGALNMYLAFKADPKRTDDPILNFRLGECYMTLGYFEDAIQAFKQVPPTSVTEDVMRDLQLYLGDCYFNTGDYNNALNSYRAFRESLPEARAEISPVNRKIKQTRIARDLIENPVNVTLSNMGNNINTEYVEGAPSISANDSIFIFTSRRPYGDKNNIDKATGEYFDDIYISYRNEDGSWTDAKRIEGDINSDGYDSNTSISPDGKTIYIYRNQKRKTRSGDIYYSNQEDDGTWGTPIPMNKNINTSYFEGSACMTADKNSLFFVSERIRRNLGQSDIWVSYFVGDNWGFSRNIGKTINTVDDEIFVTIHPDGKTMFFSSNCDNSMGGYDIFMSKKEDGKWTEPINLGYPINTIDDEYQFVLSTDGRTAYLTSNRNGTKGKEDIFIVDMQNYFKEDAEIEKDNVAIVKGTVIDANQQPLSAPITIRDMETDKVVNRIKSNDNGEYFITLESGKAYMFSIRAKGMEVVTNIINIPEGKPGEKQQFTWHFILNDK
jgi:tetratricopeptide (TPR) repeat protein